MCDILKIPKVSLFNGVETLNNMKLMLIISLSIALGSQHSILKLFSDIVFLTFLTTRRDEFQDHKVISLLDPLEHNFLNHSFYYSQYWVE